MAENKILSVVIKAKDEATKTLKETSKELEKQAGMWENLSRTMRRAGAVVTAVSTGMAVALFKTAEYWDATRRAQVALEQAFQHMPQLINENINAWYRWVEAMEEKLAVDDAELNRMGVYLSTLGLNVKQMKQLIPLIVDLSRKYQIDYQVATKAVVRAIQGETFMLERYGIMLDVSQAKTERGIDTTKSYELVVKQLTTAVGGYSDILSREGVLATERFQIVIDNIKETMGQVITEAFMPLLDDLSQFIYLMQKTNHTALVMATKIMAVASAIGLVAGPLMMIIGNLGNLLRLIMGLINPWTTLIGIIAGFIAYLYKTDDAFKQAVNTWLKQGMEWVNWLMDNWGPALQQASQWVGQLASQIAQVLTPVVDELLKIFGILVNWWQSNLPLMQRTAEAVWSAIEELWNRYGESIITITEHLWNIIKTITETLLNTILGLITAFMQLITGDWEGLGQTLQQIWWNLWEGIKRITSEALPVLTEILKIGWDLILQGLKGAWDLIYIAMVYYWEQIKNLFSTGMTTLNELWQTGWNAIYGHLKPVLDPIVNAIKVFWQTIKPIWQAGLNTLKAIWDKVFGWIKQAVDIWTTAVKGIFKAFWQLITGDWKGALNTIQTTTKAVMDKLKNLFTDIFNTLTNITKQILNAIIEMFKRLAQEALEWGKNLIRNFIQGIKSKIKDLIDAVTDVGEVIHGHLGIHSPAKEGPLRTADQWMPNLIRMMKTQLQMGAEKQLKPTIERIAKMMRGMAPPITLPVMPQPQPQPAVKVYSQEEMLAQLPKDIKEKVMKDLEGALRNPMEHQDILMEFGGIRGVAHLLGKDAREVTEGTSTTTGKDSDIANAVYRAVITAFEHIFGDGKGEIYLQIDGHTFAKLIYDDLLAEAKRRGQAEVSLV